MDWLSFASRDSAANKLLTKRNVFLGRHGGSEVFGSARIDDQAASTEDWSKWSAATVSIGRFVADLLHAAMVKPLRARQCDADRNIAIDEKRRV